MKSTCTRSLGLIALSLLLAQPAAANDGASKDIVTTAVKAGKFETLAAALKAAGLVQTLQGKGPFTVFAPTDDAFAKLPKETLAHLLKPENKAALVRVLTYHVAAGKSTAAQLGRHPRLTTVSGQGVRPQHRDKELFVNDSRVLTADIVCSNGIIHVIDTVLIPNSDDILKTAAKARTFRTLGAAVKAAMLEEALKGDGPFTVFAPTDDAFAKLPKETLASLLKPENKATLGRILRYHVVQGRKDSVAVLASRSLVTLAGPSVHVNKSKDGVAIDKSRLVKTDIDAANGIIHVIDTVLMPPEEEVTGDEVKRLIETTVARGARMYNHGDERGCARLYEQAAGQMMKMSTEVMPAAARARLGRAMTVASRLHDADRQAWALRHGLDEVYEMMSEKAGRR